MTMTEPIDLTSPSLYLNRELSLLEFQPQAVNRIPFAFARQHHLLCARVDNGHWTVYMGPDSPSHAVSELQRAAGGAVNWIVCEDTSLLDRTIQQAYSAQKHQALWWSADDRLVHRGGKTKRVF